MKRILRLFLCWGGVLGFVPGGFTQTPTPTVMAPPPVYSTAASVVLANIGDFGLASSSDEGEVAAQVLSWNPDLITTTGDDNYPAGEAGTIDANIGQYYHAYLYPYVGTYGAGAPGALNRFFPTLGNHDWYASTPVKNQPYLDYFTLPGNERYYEFIWGPVHCFMLDSDPNEPDGRSATSVQAAWLQSRLTASVSCWKLVFLHHAPYSSSSFHGSDLEMRWPYEAWGASAVFAGHDHTYERLQVGGIPYFVNGAGGAALYGFQATPLPESQARYNAEHGALRIQADAVSLRVDFIDSTGVTVDAHAVTCPYPLPTASTTAAPIDPTKDGQGPYFVPNPIRREGTTTLVLPWPCRKGRVTLHDLAGHKMAEFPLTEGTRTILPLEGQWVPGLYLATVKVLPQEGAPQVFVRKLLITPP